MTAVQLDWVAQVEDGERERVEAEELRRQVVAVAEEALTRALAVDGAAAPAASPRP